MGRFVITKRANGEFQFDLLAGNHQVILTSESYVSKSGCLNGIESVRVNASHEDRFDKKVSSSGKHFFNLKAGNGQIIGISEMYESTSARDNGIESVRKNSSDAEIDDKS